jgi:DNA-binding CsgD family transcriptional regulator/tetratricopeptide (TPR) repeat protein
MQPATHSTSRARSALTLFGRDNELGLLREHLHAARSGDGSMVLINGEAGIGKSTLSASFCREAATTGALVLSGRCYDLTSTPPYGPWVEIIARIPGDDALPAVPDQLRAGGGMAGIDSQAALFDITVRFFMDVAAVRPLVLLLEDLHWADNASLDFLRYASRWLPAASILVLATYRDDEIGHEHPLATLLPALVREGSVRRLRLGRLQRQDVLALTRERYLLPASDEERLIAYLLRLAEGNPFFTRELLQSLEEQRLLAPVVGAWGLGDLTYSGVPALIHQVIHGRVARLDPTVQSLLDAISVIGFDAPLDTLRDLYQEAHPQLDEALRGAIQNHVLAVDSGQRSVHFSHALVRQAIYEEIPPLRRQALHKRVGDLLATRSRVDPATVANHFFEAGDERALDWLIRSAELAQSLFAPRTVIAECDRAIALADDLGTGMPPGVYRLRGWALDSAGLFENALQDYDRALTQARESADRHEEWRALLDLAALWASRNYQRTGDYCRQAVDLARTMGDPGTLGHSLNRLGNWHVNAEQPSEALARHHEALHIFEAIDDPHGLASTLDLVAMTYSLIGDATESLRNYERAIPLLRQLDDRQTLSSALASAAMFSHGSWSTTTNGIQGIPASLGSRVDEPALEAIQMAREIGWRAGEAYAASQAGAAMVRRGDVRAGFQLLSDAFGIAERIQHRQWLALINVNHGSLCIDLGLPEYAIHFLERGLEEATAIGSSFFRTSAFGLLATALVQTGDAPAAERLLQRETNPDWGPRLLSEGACWYARILLLHLHGQPGDALDAIERVLASIPAGTAVPPPEWLRLRGEIHLEHGRLDLAEASLAQARSIAATHGLTLVHWRALATLCRLHHLSGRVTEALAARDDALALVNALADQMDDATMRDAFLANAHAQIAGPHPASERVESAGPDTSGLTAREMDVLRYLIEGHSDRQIAATLSVSHRTVGHHVSSILAKLDAPSRAAVTAIAIRKGLVRL